MLNFTKIKVAQKLEMSYRKLKMNIERNVLDSKMNTASSWSQHGSEKETEAIFPKSEIFLENTSCSSLR